MQVYKLSMYLLVSMGKGEEGMEVYYWDEEIIKNQVYSDIVIVNVAKWGHGEGSLWSLEQ